VFLEYISPQVSFYTGLAEWFVKPNPYLVSFGVTSLVCILATVGPYFYGRYYLKKYHSIRKTLKNLYNKALRSYM